MTDTTVAHTFQYSSAQHQAQTAIAGMWLFLASEVLFFGVLFLAWIVCRHGNQPGFDAGAGDTDLVIGTANTATLVTSSAVYSAGAAFIASGNPPRLIPCCAAAWLLRLASLTLKFWIEWRHDLSRHLFPGPDFAVTGPLRGGAQLFFVFYFLATALHGLHMLGGLGLVGWIIWCARRGDFSAEYSTPVTAVGLYWSFVDMVWIILYPLIYLVGRNP